MSAFVVSPNGEMFEYPAATYAKWGVVGDNTTYLYADATQKQFVARVPDTWALSFSRPRVLGASSADFARLKRALRAFDARTGEFAQ